MATPLLLAALGGILSERAGVFAVGLEGMMLAGSFAAVAGAAAGGAAAGVAAAAAGGAAIAVAVAVTAVRFRADQMVTGLAANILAVGATGYGARLLGGVHVALLPPLALGQPVLTWAALLLAVLVWLLLERTQAGLVLRATGENPEAAFAAGAEPQRVRMLAVIGGGALAGLGGAVLSLQQVGTFTDGMTGGRGYLALASLIVGRWTPAGAAAACLAFAAAEALELRLEAFGAPVGSYVMQMAPYGLALAVLAGLGRTARLPAALGRALPRL